MGRETSPYIVGDYWLDKRRDGKSPDIWQITRYDPQSRTERYRSTKCKSLDDAKPVIHAFVEHERTKGPQKPEDAKVVPLLFTYWEEHGKNAINSGQIASSIRQFIGFLLQDEATLDLTVAQINPQLFNRFREWRMGPHEYAVPWAGKTISHRSKGVKGESFQRNIEDIRAALNHHVKNYRLPSVPFIPSAPLSIRSKPRDRVLSIKELGAILGYAAHDKGALRWVQTMLATAARPDAALALNPIDQYNGGTLDLHPKGNPFTKKRNPVVPVIKPFAEVLDDWIKDPHKIVDSRKRFWRTMRRCLNLGPEVVPKTIRHTVATMLRGRGVPAEEVESLLGHRVHRATTEVYAKYDPQYLKKTALALTSIWRDVAAASEAWTANHLLTKIGRGQYIVVDKAKGNPQKRAIQ